MTIRTQTLILALSMLALLFSGCLRDQCKREVAYFEYVPVYMEEQAFLDAVEVQAPRAMENPGKIYLLDHFLFINEVAKGVHIFDLENPASPQNLAFISVPGNYEITSNCDRLILDSSTDLLSFDISNPAAPVLVNRFRNALPHIIQYRGYLADPNEGIVVDWQQSPATIETKCDEPLSDLIMQNTITEEDLPTIAQGGSTMRSINPAVSGKAGSMSRFALLNEHLYALMPDKISVYGLGQCSPPVLKGSMLLDQATEAEMISVLDPYLLIGSMNGMFILDASNPASPTLISTFAHVQACDPVIGDGRYAYVTLHSDMSSACGPNWNNQLDLLDISNPANPEQIASFPMHSPRGLAKDGNLLFVTNGYEGISMYDASIPERLMERELDENQLLPGDDVIADGGIAIMSGSEGFAIFDYSSGKELRHLSTIRRGN